MDWSTVFVLAGGPSVTQLDLSLLKGRRVIAINSAWRTYPDADVLFYADGRWWRRFRPNFGGEIVTTASDRPPGATWRRKVHPSAIATDRASLALKSTSVSGAINEAIHRGATLIVLLGVDGEATGARHHHGDHYPWPLVRGCFDKHAEEFRALAPSIAAAGVAVVNANPDSRIDVWPRMTLEESLEFDHERVSGAERRSAQADDIRPARRQA